jgi:quercetin dioxygenase-like cupin family protein
MEMITLHHESLTELTRHHLETARAASSGRSAQTLYGGQDHLLRQTFIALKEGASLDEHENPGEATVQVLHGRVTLMAGDSSWVGAAGDLLVVPETRHALRAEADSAILLTVALRRS